ncbi:tyrosine-type recombinase/integrase [Priestia endophytica]|uniref:tyrosine-type recombinase/integrase n=1 Tax=Priestia endophytica TaxID=135735 RepID=UPI00124F1B40|nr:tyrosine-type recombinase/integrase [Priestia endophytica]KAB2489990.1 tyrosine-type recombinase/integrase [Priestia endophytica]
MRRGELSQSEREIINKVKKVDDEQAIKEFLKSRRLKNVRETTIKYYESVFHVLYRDIKKLSIDKQLIELNEKDIEKVILLWQQNLKVTSINSKLRAIRPFYSFLQQKHWIEKNPAKDVKLLRDRKKIRETLEEVEIKKIIDYFKKQHTFASFRDLVIFQLLLDTGIRINECMNVQLNDIDGKRLIITESKNLQQRMVYLSKSMQEKLQMYINVRGSLHHDYLFINQDNERLSKNTFQERLRKGARACGIKKQVSPHVCRRTYAKKAILKGMDPFSLAVLLGHSTLEVTKRYVQIWGSDLEKQAMKKEDFSGLF